MIYNDFGKTMKKAQVSLSSLSFAQKLDLMESLWADLTHDERKMDSPAWHEDVLKDRGKAFDAGKTTASDWVQAKKRIKKKVS